ncbi:MAG: cbb3-type cytochrome c oxidase subunit 3 [Rhodospirillaceae bacterium]|nr:cbb3-type cytochrome c oxidase subunit 3 [Rhodospirillaceae bacterium]MDD9928310.1 cbb3-type cytochrome c oxidase subunit 3 [Rhodospirillaceae bacterium]
MFDETITSSAQVWGLVFFVVLFAGVVAYALWPSNKGKFDRAARAPLDDDFIED